MRIVDVDDATEPLWLACLKDWAEEPRGAAHRAAWLHRMREHGLRVKLALTADGVPGGMIQYVPIEYSPAIGRELFFIQCTWVHGYQEGPGDLQHQGMGRALLDAAEQDVRKLGSKGMAAWGNTFPGWMPASWLMEHGYAEVDRQGSRLLAWKSFAPDAIAPKWRVRSKTPVAVPGVVTVTSFFHPWCGDACDFHQRAAELVAEMGDGVEFVPVDTSTPEALDEWGINNAVFVNDRHITGGLQELRDAIESELENGASRRSQR